jgi:hypothetical protein
MQQGLQRGFAWLQYADPCKGMQGKIAHLCKAYIIEI